MCKVGAMLPTEVLTGACHLRGRLGTGALNKWLGLPRSVRDGNVLPKTEVQKWVSWSVIVRCCVRWHRGQESLPRVEVPRIHLIS